MLKIRNLNYSYDLDKPVLSNINIDLIKGDIVSILGQSGCGKTTLLRLIAGLEENSTGEIEIANEIVSGNEIFIPAHKRNVGLVVQEKALFPHLTVMKNVKFGITGSRAEKNEIALKFLKLFKVDQYQDSYPNKLSGGEQQRVAIARAMAPNPKLLLMDEPFGSLDKELREELREEVKKVLRDNQTTCIIVTHDTEDANAMGNKTIKLDKGKRL
jgi:iron(III) transport system ATP-binding protein|tara:strand:- start:36 stop:677 length:642 start_codon:yes stop_codon:yes gene_type:complete